MRLFRALFMILCLFSSLNLNGHIKSVLLLRFIYSNSIAHLPLMIDRLGFRARVNLLPQIVFLLLFGILLLFLRAGCLVALVITLIEGHIILLLFELLHLLLDSLVLLNALRRLGLVLIFFEAILSAAVAVIRVHIAKDVVFVF